MKKIKPCESCDYQNSSNCCGAEIIHGDICSLCKEHCDTMCEDCEEVNELLNLKTETNENI